jgi:hypothetical protein
MNLVQTKQFPATIRKVGCNIINGALSYDKMIHRQIKASPGGEIIGILIHQVLNQTGRFAYAPLPG